MSKRVQVALTHGQLRCVNAALALLESEVELDIGAHGVRLSTVENTRRAVWDAMRAGQVEP